jgi:hypothetical protein
VLTNILSFSIDAQSLFAFYAASRNIIAKESGCAKSDLFDNVSVKFDSLKLIMQMIFKEKFPQKIHLLKDLTKSLKASFLLNQLVIDWLVNTGSLESKPKKKVVTSRSVPRATPNSPSPSPSATGIIGKLRYGNGRPMASNRKHLDDFVGPDTPTIIKYIQREKSRPQNNGKQIKENLERLNNERLYLLRAQEQTDVKVGKFRTANADLVKEHNQLLEKGKKMYDMFFEMFYSLKLNPKAKIAKMEFSEEEIGRFKDFKAFQKLKVSDPEAAEENPMTKIIRSKSSNLILKSEIQPTNQSRIRQSIHKPRESSYAGLAI